MRTNNKPKLSQIGKDLGKRAFKDFIMLWFKKTDVEKALEGISLWCRYAGVAEYDLETEGVNYTITLHHDIGEKWSNPLYLSKKRRRSNRKRRINP